MRDLFAMVRQLGIPTWFCSFSAADRRWTVIDEAILQQQGKAIPKNIDWATHCQIIASNPVTATRMFEHRVQAFIKDVILSPAQPIGHVIDYFYRVEFQQRGWPHIHCLFWVKDAPLYGNSHTDEIVAFIDKYVSCKMPSAATEPKLHEKVLHVQMHSKNHSRSCRKGNRTCRFNFPRLPSKTTFISRPAVDADSVNNPTPGYSNAVKKLWDSFHHDTDHSLTIDEAFQRAGITQQQLQDCVTANTQKETIWLRREPSDIWVNNYNPILLMAWDANMDIQFVLDAYSCIMYIVSYISKAEREMGDLLKTAQQEAREGNVNAMDELRKLGSLYLHHREVSVMESVYRVTGMHMKQCSRQAIFIPTDPDSQRLSLPLQQLQNKQEDTDEIWMPNMIDKYLGRPKELANICLATFASEYRYIGQQNNATDSISLTTGLGTIKKRLHKPAIIRYPKVKIQKDREKYYSTILRLYLPFTVEEFKPSTYDTFESYFLQGSYNGKFVREIVAANMQKYEPLAKELDNLWENLQENPYQENSWANLAPQTEMERIQHTQEMSTEEYIPPECSEIISELQQPTFSSNGMVGEFALERMDSSVLQSEITSMLRTLNNEQRQLFNHMQQWSKHKVNDNDTKPPYIFLTGGAGTGKSQLIKCITHELRKCFSKIAESPDDITVLLVAYTGTAAFNIHGQTIHSAFNIFNPTKHYKPLREEHLNTLCAKYRSLQLVIIDEISMVDHNMLLYIHGRLQQIKRSDTMHIFGNVGILAVGDFYQIQPVFGKPLYRKDHGAFVDLWSMFSLWELTKIMRQKDDISYAELLNRLRNHGKGQQLLQSDTQMLELRVVKDIPKNVPFIAAKKAVVDAHNIKMLHSLQSRVEFIEAVDIIGTANATLKKLLKPTPNAKSTLPAELNIAIGARVMLTTNLDVADGLVNGVTGKVTGIVHGNLPNNQPEAICILFDNPRIGANCRRKYLPPANVAQGSVVILPHKEIYQIRLQHVTRQQFPLKLAWAFTIHKVQGMTMERATVSFTGIFQAGMAYVALSRVVTLGGLYLTDFDSNLIYCNAEVQDSISNMPRCNLQSSNMLLHSEMNFSILHHNTQSLFCHYKDIISNPEFIKADIICLSETWLTSVKLHCIQIPGYNLHCSNQQARGQGVAIYIREKYSGIINNSDPKKPYHPPLKVVLATRSDRIFYKKGTTDKEMMYVALCDTTGHLKATLYEPSKLDNITNGSTIIIRNYMVRDDKTIAITSQSQIFKSSQLQVPENLLSQAISSVRPPTPPPIPIKEVHTSPVKTLTSVSGVIAQDELPRQVHVRGEPVPVRTILLEDREAKVKVALWRNESGAQIQAGHFVSIQNVMKTERPAEDISEEIIAYIEDENDMIHLLLASNEMLSTNIELLKTTFNIEDDNWQPVLEAFIPFKANMTVKEGEITRINIQSVANMDNP
ncbi:ATP-dependent DNA helicase PIF1 [Holothuria leucospilota]|uniref:ATP-dependent DNA helicase n=1 Tax=Holothuria leucospilota TaxID=206669 RepID=A0A9Q1BJA3_HOLLE|nr:ATP-dependent DNA helicase PIF1 [Holothuria leucospilota]